MSANGHISESFVSTVLEGSTLTDVSMLAFPDPKHFVARELHCHLELWSYVASLTPCDLAPQLLNWIMNSVDVHEFFQHFKGCYKGEAYDSTLPPRRVFLNHPSSKPFVKFISATLLDRLSTGAISLWGKVGEVQPPHLAMPLIVEPSKPRLCNDCFLNLWIADRPFQLDSLRDVVRYTPLDYFQTICDGKSGYDHIFLLSLVEHISLSVGGGWFFTSNSLPFRWKSSAYIYHTTGLLASLYFRSLGINCSLNIDDRQMGQIHFASQVVPTPCKNFSSQRDSNFTIANVAIVVSYTLVSLGYFLGLQKSILVHAGPFSWFYVALPFTGFHPSAV